MSLREVQQLMGKAVMSPLTARQGMQASNIEIAEKIISPNSRLSSFERLELYNRQYWFRVIDCLYDDFQGLHAVVGEKRFYNLVIAYLNKYPSNTFALRNLGENIVKFLSAEPEWLGARRLAGIDMAKFEWAQIVAFDGKANPPLKPEALVGADPTSLKLYLQPYLTILKLNYPFDDFVLAMRKQQSERSEASSERLRGDEKAARAQLPKKSLTYLVVHRFHNNLFYKRLDKAAHTLLTLLQEGKVLSEACAQAIPLLPRKILDKDGGAATLQAWFANWSELQWFCAQEHF
jgi:hypothetical protein